MGNVFSDFEVYAAPDDVDEGCFLSSSEDSYYSDMSEEEDAAASELRDSGGRLERRALHVTENALTRETRFGPARERMPKYLYMVADKRELRRTATVYRAPDQAEDGSVRLYDADRLDRHVRLDVFDDDACAEAAETTHVLRDPTHVLLVLDYRHLDERNAVSWTRDKHAYPHLTRPLDTTADLYAEVPLVFNTRTRTVVHPDASTVARGMQKSAQILIGHASSR